MEEDGGVEEEEGAVGGLLGVAEALGLVNEVNQTLLGVRRRTGRWRVEEEEEEDDALRLQEHLTQQGLQVCRSMLPAGWKSRSPKPYLRSREGGWTTRAL